MRSDSTLINVKRSLTLATTLSLICAGNALAGGHHSKPVSAGKPAANSAPKPTPTRAKPPESPSSKKSSPEQQELFPERNEVKLPFYPRAVLFSSREEGSLLIATKDRILRLSLSECGHENLQRLAGHMGNASAALQEDGHALDCVERPHALAESNDGSVYFDCRNMIVRIGGSTGIATRVLGLQYGVSGSTPHGGHPRATAILEPRGIALSEKSLYVSDFINQRVLRVPLDKPVSTELIANSTPRGLAFRDGVLYVSSTDSQSVQGISEKTGEQVFQSPSFTGTPDSLAASSTGALYVTDADCKHTGVIATIQKITGSTKSEILRQEGCSFFTSISAVGDAALFVVTDEIGDGGKGELVLFEEHPAKPSFEVVREALLKGRTREAKHYIDILLDISRKGAKSRFDPFEEEIRLALDGPLVIDAINTVIDFATAPDVSTFRKFRARFTLRDLRQDVEVGKEARKLIDNQSAKQQKK